MSAQPRFARRSVRLLTAFVVSLALAIGAAGCAKSDPQQPPKPSYKGNLVLWAAPGLAGSPVTARPAGSWFEEQARAFEAANKDITVTVRLFESAAALEKAVAEGAEKAPDVAFGRMVSEAVPRLAGLAPNEMMDRWHAGAYGFVRKELHGIPMVMEVQALALNEQAFAQAGVALPENGRWTQTAFENSLRTLSGNGRFGLGFYQLPGYHEYWPFLSGLVTPDGKIADGAEAGLANLVRYRKEGWLHPDTGKIKAEQTWSLFAQGKIAVMPVSGWAVPLLRQAPYNAKFTVAGFPGDMTVGYTYGFMLFRQDDREKQLAASSLASFMAGPDKQVLLARETGLVPVSKAATNPYEGDAQMTRLYQLAAQQRALPAGPAWEKAEAAFFRSLLLGTLGEKAPGATLPETQQHIQSAITPASK